MPAVRTVIWVVEGTWQGCVDVAAQHLPPGNPVALLHVTPSDVGDVAEAAGVGLLGRAWGGGKPTAQFQEIAAEAGAQLLATAAARLGREDVELIQRQGRVEREVVRAVAEDVDLLVVARDGDHSRLGPKSLGPATRFVVDHAPCAVLLVWPDGPPGIESLPPPPH
ncbi:MAG TPA: universal stress protein [Candidatus Nanopelagicaceae bacterium]|nr:universal stress protein [Candidatus Nanopelagicaceae bacterium]